MKVNTPIEMYGNPLVARGVDLKKQNVEVRKIKDYITASDIRELPKHIQKRIYKDKDLKDTLKELDEKGLAIRSEQGLRFLEIAFGPDRQDEVIFEMKDDYYIAFAPHLKIKNKPFHRLGKPGDLINWNDNFGEIRITAKDKLFRKPVFIAAASVALGIAAGLVLKAVSPAVVPNVVRNIVSVGGNATVSLGSRILAFIKNLKPQQNIPIAGGLLAGISALVGLAHKRGGAVAALTEDIKQTPQTQQPSQEASEEVKKLN